MPHLRIETVNLYTLYLIRRIYPWINSKLFKLLTFGMYHILSTKPCKGTLTILLHHLFVALVCIGIDCTSRRILKIRSVCSSLGCEPTNRLEPVTNRSYGFASSRTQRTAKGRRGEAPNSGVYRFRREIARLENRCAPDENLIVYVPVEGDQIRGLNGHGGRGR